MTPPRTAPKALQARFALATGLPIKMSAAGSYPSPASPEPATADSDAAVAARPPAVVERCDRCDGSGWSRPWLDPCDPCYGLGRTVSRGELPTPHAMAVELEQHVIDALECAEPQLPEEVMDALVLAADTLRAAHIRGELVDVLREQNARLRAELGYVREQGYRHVELVLERERERDQARKERDAAQAELLRRCSAKGEV